MEKDIMNLLRAATEKYFILDLKTTDDGYGGYASVYTKGAEIYGAMRFDNSIEAVKAMASGVNSVYTFITEKNINLQYHQVIQRERDNKIFRITSDGDDSFTPEGAGLNMRLVTAEEWTLPNG